jgi:hypothetical protein
MAAAVPPLLPPGTEGQVIAGPSIGQFMKIGFPEHDGAGRFELRHQGGIVSWAESSKCGGTAGGRKILGVDTVFDGNRQAEQRSQEAAFAPRAILAPRLFQDTVGVKGDEGIERSRATTLLDQGLRVGLDREIPARHVVDGVGGAQFDQGGCARSGCGE